MENREWGIGNRRGATRTLVDCDCTGNIRERSLPQRLQATVPCAQDWR